MDDVSWGEDDIHGEEKKDPKPATEEEAKEESSEAVQEVDQKPDEAEGEDREMTPEDTPSANEGSSGVFNGGESSEPGVFQPSLNESDDE